MDYYNYEEKTKIVKKENIIRTNNQQYLIYEIKQHNNA